MEIKVIRKYCKEGYTIGVLSINGVVICNTLEPTDRGLTSAYSLKSIKRIKLLGKTAIPTGSYPITMRYSSHFNSQRPFLTGVRGYDGVMIHEGNSVSDTLGCILVGENSRKGMVLNSRSHLNRLISLIKEAVSRHETVTITISRQ